MEEILRKYGEALYGYILHYNPHTGLWTAVPRDEYIDYWNGTCANCLHNSDLSQLILDIYENVQE